MSTGGSLMPSMVCAMDCGGSKNHGVLATADGRVVGQCRGLGAANVFDRGQARTLLEPVATALLQAAAVSAAAVRAVQVTLGGLNDETVFSVLAELFPAATVKVCRESTGAAIFAGSRWWGFDLALMAGTGVVAVGSAADGRRGSAGGWGPLIHDLGSGYSLGQQTLRRLAERIDERGGFTAILPALATAAPFQTSLSALTFLDLAPARMSEAQRLRLKDALKAVIPLLDRRAVAGLYPLVSAGAAAGDELALELVREAAESLARTTAALAANLELPAPRIIPLGGLFQAGGVLAAAYGEAVRRRLPQAVVQPGDFSQIMGTLLLAWETAGVTVTERHIAAVRGLNPAESSQGVK